MDWPWIVGAIIFVAWFAVFEFYAFKHPNRINTLSTAVATLGARWPLSIFLFGLLIGGLAVHFWWPWAANPLGPGTGFLILPGIVVLG